MMAFKKLDDDDDDGGDDDDDDVKKTDPNSFLQLKVDY